MSALASRKRGVALLVVEAADAESRALERPAHQQPEPHAPERGALAPDARKRLVSALADVVLADLFRYPRQP